MKIQQTRSTTQGLFRKNSFGLVVLLVAMLVASAYSDIVCPENCATCTSETECTSCKQPDKQEKTKQCMFHTCPNPKCHYCADDQSNDCTVCFTNENLKEGTNSCECVNDTHYWFDEKIRTNGCKACDSEDFNKGCDTCKYTREQEKHFECTKCKADADRLIDTIHCTCKDTYYYVEEAPFCKECPEGCNEKGCKSDTECIECTDKTMDPKQACTKPLPCKNEKCKTCTEEQDKEGKCTLCHADEALVNPDKKDTCECKDKYYFGDRQCTACSTHHNNNCISCTKDACLKCLEEYQDPENECKKYQCDNERCKSCTSEQNKEKKCSACKADDSLIGNKETCTCIAGYYFDATSEDDACKKCDIKGCAQCSKEGDKEVCNSCRGDATFDEDKNECVCKEGQYTDNDRIEFCIDCDSKCGTCDINNGDCKTCVDEQKREFNSETKKCECVEGFGDKEGQDLCIQLDCARKCKTCKGQTTNCLECTEGSNRNSINHKTSPCECSTGFYESTNEVDCKSCTKHSQFCTECNENNCSKCSEDSRDPTNKCNCRPGFELQGGKCIETPFTLFDAIGTEEEQEARCMSTDLLNGRRNCQICRQDKNQFGQNYDAKQAGQLTCDKTEEDKGTYAIRRDRSESLIFRCDSHRNEHAAEQRPGDQEANRIQFCGMYDDYGLCIRCLDGYARQWVDQSTDTKTDGVYECVENKVRVPFCEEYDANFRCIRCKWNQNPEYSSLYSEEEYELDYALYEFGDHQFCINNRDGGISAKSINSNFIASNLSKHCLEYNDDYHCIKCHTRTFDLEGENMWKTLHYDYWLAQNSSGNYYCQAFPSTFVTDPLQGLETFQKSATNILTRKCSKNYQDVQYGSNLQYGCVRSSEIPDGCKTHMLAWDFDNFQKTGIWYKKYHKCAACEDGKLLTEDGKCVKAIAYCSLADKYGKCLSCQGNRWLLYVSESENQCATSPTSIQISNCKKNKLTKSGNQYINECLECNYPYILQQTGDKDKVNKCVHYNNAHVQKGCYLLNKEGTACVNDQRIEGWNADNKCQSGIHQRIDSACMKPNGKILNCHEYVLFEKEGIERCNKCKNGYELSFSRTECTLAPNYGASGNQYVENCVDMDGPWCRRCQEQHILTDANTCVKYKETDFEYCEYAKYNKQGNFEYDNISECVQCKPGYIKSKDARKCVSDINCNDGSDVTKQLFYSYDDILNAKCGDAHKDNDNCLYYRDSNAQKCFQCNQKNNQYYGVNLEGKCRPCGNGKKLGKSITGEEICVSPVANCSMYYAEFNYCAICSEGYALNIVGNSVICTEIGPEDGKCKESQVKEAAYSKAKICINKDDDFTHCKGNVYQIFQHNDKLKVVCADCGRDEGNNEYFIKITNDGNLACQTKSEAIEDQFPSVNMLVESKKGDTTVLSIGAMLTGNTLNSPCRNGHSLYEDSTTGKFRCGKQVAGSLISGCFHFNENKTEESKTTCARCYPGYFLSADKKSCVDQSAIPYNALSTAVVPANCWYNKATNACLRCDYGFILIGSKCYATPHPACVKATNIAKSISCSKCQHPYYNIGGSCHLLPKKCLKLDTSGNCSECEQGFQYYKGECLRRTQDCWDQDWDKTVNMMSSTKNSIEAGVCKSCWQGADKIRLFKERPTKVGAKSLLVESCVYGCKTLKRSMKERVSNNIHNLWSCEECRAEDYHPYDDTKRCVPHTKIENCSKYSQKGIVAFSEICTLCAIDHYLSDNKCLTCNPPANCDQQDNVNEANVDPNDDKNRICKCNKCKAGYFLSSQDAKCKPEVRQCTEYDNSDTCIKCASGYFLNQNQCSENTALNCATRSPTVNQCLTCIEKHYFNKQTNQCESGNVDHCQILESRDVCSLCEVGYGLSQKTKKCVDNSQSNAIDNCLEYTELTKDNKPVYTCLDCRTSKYYQAANGKGGYAPDFRLKYSDNDSFCRQFNYCLESSTDLNDNHYCLRCMVSYGDDKSHTRVYYTAGNTPSCELEGSNVSYKVKFCRKYKEVNKCQECHQGYHVDASGTKCVSDDHPAAIAACSTYDSMGAGTNQKYEGLHCEICDNLYQYYRCELNKSSTSGVKSYNYNSYRRYCDVQDTYTVDGPGLELYPGKDGGVVDLSKTGETTEPTPTETTDGEHDSASHLMKASALLFVVLSVLLI